MKACGTSASDKGLPCCGRTRFWRCSRSLVFWRYCKGISSKLPFPRDRPLWFAFLRTNQNVFKCCLFHVKDCASIATAERPGCWYFLTSALVGVEWSASRPDRFIPKERAPGPHWIGGWVGPRAGLDEVEKGKFLNLPELELRPLGHPARNQSLYRLH
jgi:hypothetical protein